MGFFKRLFGICSTQLPEDSGCWSVEGQTLEVDLDKAPELAEPGGAIRLEDKEGKLPGRILVVHGQDGEYHALSNKCTHGGRRLDPLAGQERVQCCSVGKTTFDYKGTVLSGSGKEDIKAFSLERQDRKLVISL